MPTFATRIVLLAALVLVVTGPAAADSITLKSGEMIRGQIDRFADGELLVTVPSATETYMSRTFPIADVESFEIERLEIIAGGIEAPTAPAEHTVAAVVSGDTVVLSNGETVKYLGVQAPALPPEAERPEPLAEEARRFNEDLVKGKNIALQFERGVIRDEEGFLWAYVYADGEMVNAKMIEEGYARVMKKPRPRRHDVLFLQLQDNALHKGAGIWALPERFRPQETRREGAEGAGDELYISSKYSERYHLPACEWAAGIGEHSKLEYHSHQEARDSGRKPCPICLPGE